MKSWTKVVACVGMLAGVGLLAAAAWQPATSAKAAAGNLPVVTIQEIETDSPEDYAMWVAQGNKAIYDKIHVENYTKVMLGQAAGEDSGKVVAVQTGESFAKLAENGQLFENDPGLAKIRAGMSQVRKLGSQVACKAVRFDGRNPSSISYNTKVVLSDEGAYLKALDGLRGLLDSHGFKDVKINCYRVVAGRKDYTHLVSLNSPTVERRAAMMDAIASEAWAQEWVESVGKIRTVVTNGTYKEITK